MPIIKEIALEDVLSEEKAEGIRQKIRSELTDIAIFSFIPLFFFVIGFIALYIDDLASALFFILMAFLSSSRIFNIARRVMEKITANAINISRDD